MRIAARTAQYHRLIQPLVESTGNAVQFEFICKLVSITLKIDKCIQLLIVLNPRVLNTYL